MERVLLLEIGSIQTKAILLMIKDGNLKIVGKSRGKTTVEHEELAVRYGVEQVLDLLTAQCGVELADIDKVYISSSAGGGLQMVVAGVVKTMTAESAWRAALGTGAIVTEVIHGGSAISQPERLNTLKKTNPDIILLAGGTEGGNIKQVIGLAETIGAAQIAARWHQGLAPVVFAGNSEVRDAVKQFLEPNIAVFMAENIRPELETEQVEMVNETVQQLYIQQVANNIPGFEQLSNEFNTAIRPTAVGMKDLLDKWAIANKCNAILFDVGGFTTDSFSSIEYVRRAYKRASEKDKTIYINIGDIRERKTFTAISATAGLNYSAARLLQKSKVKTLAKLLKHIDEKAVYNACYNRMINPLSEEMYQDKLTPSLVFAALRVALQEHQEIAGKLHGVGIVRNMAEVLNQLSPSAGTIAEWTQIDRLVVTGGVFPQLVEAEILVVVNDALRPTGVTELYLDHQDLLSQVSTLMETASVVDLVTEVLTPLTTIVAPLRTGRMPHSLAQLTMTFMDGSTESRELYRDTLEFFGSNQLVKLQINPHRKVDFGAGAGVAVSKDIVSTKYGVLLDGRSAEFDEVTYTQLERWYGRAWEKVCEVSQNE